MSIDLKIISADDWEALYVGGELVDEAHSLNWPRTLEDHLKNTHVGSIMRFEIGNEWLEENGLPKYFGEIPHEELE